MGRIKRIGDKFYDTGTSNASFLQVARDLKTVGVKNFYFMLEIYDHTLVNVDPFSKDLTKDQISRIITECTRNIWYYIREVAMIPSHGGAPVHFKANRGNIAQIWCFLHGIDSWLCLPRQQGKTESLLTALAWAYSFGTNDSTFIFINKDSSNAKSNLERVKTQIRYLPDYLQFTSIEEVDEESGKVTTVKATMNALTMVHPVTKNKIIVKAQARSYEGALSLARGLTAPILHFDEPEFTNHIKTIVENSVSTYETAARNARKNHALYGRCFSCTPGDLDTAMGMEAQLILNSTTKWTEKMYDMQYEYVAEGPQDCELMQYVKGNGTNGIVYIEYSYKQIGLTEEWFREMFNMIHNPVTVKREILLQRLRGSSNSPFAQEDVEYIVNSIQSIVDELFIAEHFRFDIYEPLRRTVPYMVGVDCSTGTMGDNNAVTIFNPITEKPVAEFLCPYVGETLFEQILIDLVKNYIPRACLIIERNSVGDGIIDHLLNSPIAANLYRDKDADLVKVNMQDKEIVRSMLEKRAREKTYYGVYTQGKSREAMMAILMRHVAERKEDFVTKNITDDITKLVTMSSGKIAAGPGFHDDSIMSYLMVMYVWYHGNNLLSYGIKKGSKEISNQNEGLHNEEFDVARLSKVLPEKDVDILKRRREVQEENNYEEILRQAMIQSQQESMLFEKKRFAKTQFLHDTPDIVLEEIDSQARGSIPLSFFDEIN